MTTIQKSFLSKTSRKEKLFSLENGQILREEKNKETFSMYRNFPKDLVLFSPVLK
jgi:hypothetical protein